MFVTTHKKMEKKMGVLTHNQPTNVSQHREKLALTDRVVMLNDTDTIPQSPSLKALHEINSRQEELPIKLQEWTFHPIEDLQKEVAHIDSLYSWLIQGNHPQKDLVDPLFNRLSTVEKEAHRLKAAGSLQPQQLSEITSFIQKVDQTLKASETWLGMKKDYLECEARLEQELSELTDHMEGSLDGMHPDALDHLKGGLSYLQQLLHFSKLISLRNSDSSFDQTFKQNIPKEYELSLRAFCLASEDYLYQILDYLDSPKGVREKELPQLTSFIEKAKDILPKLETDISNSQISELSNLKKALLTLNSRLAELHTVPVVYDETEEESFFSRCSKYLAPLNPENWSDTTKRCVFAGLVAMQLSAEGIKVHENIKYGKPLPPAPSLLSDEQQDMLDREVAYMGTLLRDKYASLQKKRAFEALTKRAPETREGLQKMLEQFGPNQPTSAQIQESLESYRLARTQVFLFSHPQGREVQPLEGESSSETSYIQSIWNYFFGAQEEVRESTPEPSAPVEDEIVSFISTYDSKESPSQVDQLSKILQQLSETSLASEHVLSEVSQQEETQKMIMARVDSIFSGTAGELARIRAEIEMLKTVLGSSDHTKKLLIKHASLVEQMEAVQEKWEVTTLDQEDVRSLFIAIDQLGKDLELFRLSYSQAAQDTRNAQVLETFLASSTPYSITNQMLLHILGDSYGSKTKLEGGSSESFLEFLIDVIHKRMDSLASHQLCSEEEQVDFCQDFIGELSFDPIHQETFSELKQHMSWAVL